MKNREYWQQRFIKLQETQEKGTSRYINILEEEYERAVANIEKDISSWYTRIAVNNQVTLSDAKKILDTKQLKEFHWNVEEYIKKGEENEVNSKWIKELENASARVHIERLEAIKIQIQNELEHLYTKQDKEIESVVKQQYQDSYYKSAYEIQSGLEQYWNIQPLDTNKIQKLISKPWTTDNQTFSDRVWKNKVELANTLQTELTQAIIRGDSLNNIIGNISKKFNVARNKASRLVMTESAFFSSAGQKECFNNLGVKKYEIVATLDIHTSEICQELDGKVFDMKDYEVGITAPPFHCNCRSTTAPYFDDEFTKTEQRIYRDEEGNIGYADSTMKYKEWKEKYVTNNSDDAIIENAEYVRKNNITDNRVLDDKINKVSKLFPQYIQEYIKNTPIVAIGKGKNNHYLNGTLYLLNDATQEEIIHEIGHLIEEKFDIVNDDKYQRILKQNIGKINIIENPIGSMEGYDPDKYEFLLTGDNFVSDYQRRVYNIDINQNDRINYQNGTFNYNVFRDYLPEGLRCYFSNRQLLKTKNIELYKYIKGVLNERE